MPRLLYDVTGLLHWYGFFRRPAGVQRVIEKVATCAPVFEAARASVPISVEFVVRILGSNRFYRLDPALLSSLGMDRRSAIVHLRRAFAHYMRLATARGLLAEGRYPHLPYLALGWLRLDGILGAPGAPAPGAILQPAAPPTEGDAYFNPGDLWWQKGYAAALADLKKRTGVRIVQMIFDLYVLQRPDWSPPGFSNTFVRQFRGIAPYVDRWLTSSDHVRAEVAGCLQGWSAPPAPVEVLPFGWDSFAGIPPNSTGDDQKILARRGMGRRRYILFVGTVEPRKNLPALLDALGNLRSRMGDRVPVLALAGSYGWSAQSVRRRLLREVKAGNVVQATNLSDEELRAFYRGALFTVMPSHGEGWGLAIQESIALGVPCIASSGGATREAGAGLARYVDPGDVVALEEAMASWIVDDALLAGVRATIQRELQARRLPTWDDAGRVLLARAFSAGPA